MNEDKRPVLSVERDGEIVMTIRAEVGEDPDGTDAFLFLDEHGQLIKLEPGDKIAITCHCPVDGESNGIDPPEATL